MNSLDKKFKHSIWFKGKDMTVREFLEYAAHAYGAFGIVKRPSLKQSENLLDEAVKMAEEIAAQAPIAVALCKATTQNITISEYLSYSQMTKKPWKNSYFLCQF